MATLTATSWTVLLRHATAVTKNSTAQSVDTNYGRRLKYVNATMTLVSGSSPAAGVPWPDKSAFGFRRSLDAIILQNRYPYGTATLSANTVSGKYVIADSNATAGRIRFYKLTMTSGTGTRPYYTLATTAVITTGAKFYVTAAGWAFAAAVMLPTLRVLGGLWS